MENNKLVDFLKGRDVTIVAPHNDDEIVGCMHLMEAISGKVPINLIVVTKHVDSINLTHQRRLETKAALGNLEINEIIDWNFPDGDVGKFSDAIRAKFQMLSAKCDIVLCPAPNDKTKDHITIAQIALQELPCEQLIWYRSTWWTFRMRQANFIVTGQFRKKLNKLKLFKSQSHISLHRSVWLSCLEHLLLTGRVRSSEAFVFANTDSLSAYPLNSISLRHIYRILFW